MRIRSQETGEFPEVRQSIRQRWAWILVALICAFASSQAQTTTPKIREKKSGQALADGKQTFESICASCHGLNGKGGERARDIATKPEVVRLSDVETFQILREGILQEGMPAFASLGPTRLADLVSYLRVLQGKNKAPAITANTEEGKLIFVGKGGCSQCHMVNGVGGFLGPDLSDYGASHSPDEIRNAVLSADKRPGGHKGLAKARTRDGQQISGLVRNEDNFSVQLQALDGSFHLLEKSSLSELTFGSTPIMPSDYGSRLSKTELDQLVGYLLSIGDAKR